MQMIDTLLSSIAVFFNMAFYISVFHGSSIVDFDRRDLWFLGLSNMIKALQGLSVAVTLYLNFAFNIELYMKCCKCCHVCCYRVFVRMAKHRIAAKQLQHGKVDSVEVEKELQTLE